MVKRNKNGHIVKYRCDYCMEFKKGASYRNQIIHIWECENCWKCEHLELPRKTESFLEAEKTA